MGERDLEATLRARIERQSRHIEELAAALRARNEELAKWKARETEMQARAQRLKAREDDRLRSIEAEPARLREERDDARQAARDADARYFALLKRTRLTEAA